ncbi:MAG: hypothetical protein HXY25_11240, partial [Alphaproteobacteria bacterium]|nr:hypothetical protein [Alphaproteobacteria bacterium]
MRGVFLRLVVWALVIAIAWLAGARYGAPGWLAALTDPAFSAIERQLGAAPPATEEPTPEAPAPA